MSVLIYCYYIKKLYMWSTNLGINQTIKLLANADNSIQKSRIQQTRNMIIELIPER
jgi:hypothetical protein